jgi:hypothetical protein
MSASSFGPIRLVMEPVAAKHRVHFEEEPQPQEAQDG